MVVACLVLGMVLLWPGRSAEEEALEDRYREIVDQLGKGSDYEPPPLPDRLRTLIDGNNTEKCPDGFGVVTPEMESISKKVEASQRSTILALLRCLRHESILIRERAMICLSHCRPVPPEMGRTLVLYVTDADCWMIRAWAASSLGDPALHGDQLPEGSVESLAKATRDENPTVRSMAINALGSCGSGNSSAVYALERLVRNGDDRERMLAKESLEAINKANKRTDQ